jgi:hypothetical protein
MTAPTPGPAMDRHFAALLRAAIVAALALVIVLATFWTLTNVSSIFITMFLPIAAWLALGGVAVWGLVLALRRRKDGKKPWLPFAICLAAAAIGAFVPFTDVWLSANYHLHRAARKRVVTALETGQLPTPSTLNSTMVVHLPWAAGTSSGGGDILVEREEGRLLVLFFTYRGILSHYSGYIYSSDDPPGLSEAFGDHVRQLTKMEPHWFFAAFY